METNSSKNLSYIPLIYGGFFIAVIVLLLTRYQPYANDDVFIYFNYARNMADGRFFAYDVRNIPSEGFTSLLYLLLLTPFEFFNINMMFASFVINLSAIIITVYLLYRLLKVSQILSEQGILFVIALFVMVMIYDNSMIANLNWGLETFLGPAVMFGGALAIAYASQPYLSKRAVNIFFVVLFLSYIIRPESIAFLGLLGFLSLLSIPEHRKQVLIATFVFGIVFIAYHGLKYLIFDDFLPTGFYRKVGDNDGEGVRYVLSWVIGKILWIGVLLVALVTQKPLRQFFKTRWVLSILGVSIITLLFFTLTRPLIGVGHRFLVNPTFTIYFLTIISVVLFVETRLKATERVYSAVIIIFSVVLLFTMVAITGSQVIQNLNVYAKAEKTVSEHYYIQFGEHLHNTLSHPEEITLVFGDAGAIPYALQGTFIDTNGLTEPPLARLFRQPDDAEKIETYVNHILSYDPDIVVLAWGNVSETGMSMTNFNYHSPFDIPTPIELYTAYQDHNIIYACSLQFYYALHIGLWKDSPHYDELQASIASICDEKGYVLENGLTITDGSQSILFALDEDQ